MAFLERNANRGSISLEYDIDYSVKMESYYNAENLTRTPSSAGNQKTWTWSWWIKVTEPSHSLGTMWAGGTGSNDGSVNFRIDAGQITVNTASTALRNTTARFRDPSAWYHLVLVMDTTQSTADDRIKLYVNGSQITDFSTTNNPSQNADMGVNSTQLHALGRRSNANDRYFHGYMAEVNFVDGSAKAPTDFGRTDSNGVWVAKEYAGSYGTNGFYLDFADSSDLGDDESGNGNDFTENNISAQDQATDTPTNNFCTMNQGAHTNGNIRTQEGGTRVSTDGGSGWCSMVATMGVGAGKWYWEAKYHDHSGDTNTVYVGVAPANDPWIPARQGGYYLGNVETGGSMGWYLHDGSNKNQAGSWGNPSYGDKLMFALDMDNYRMYYGINGTWGNSSDPANGTNPLTFNTYWMAGHPNLTDFVMPAVAIYQGNYMRSFNFGGICTWNDDISSAQSDANGYGRFEYTPPSGYYALCTKNLAQYGG